MNLLLSGRTYVAYVRDRMTFFWERHPALYFGCPLLIGVHLCKCTYSFFDAILLFFIPFIYTKSRFFFSCVIVTVSFFSLQLRIAMPSEPAAYVGTTVGYVIDRKTSSYHGKDGWIITFYVKRFENAKKGICFGGFPVRVYSGSPCSLIGGYTYTFLSRLVFDEQMNGSLRILSPQTVLSSPDVGWPVELVVGTRRSLERIFGVLFDDPDIRQIAGALSFALFHDDTIAELLHRIGVEHVLVVSGFHFGIIAALLLYLGRKIEDFCVFFGLNFISRYHFGNILTAVFLTTYLFIIGPIPSVVRAYTSSFVAILALFCSRKSNGLQALGISMIVSVVFDPLSICTVGYDLSFLSTGAILLFSKIYGRIFVAFFPKRSFEEVALGSYLDRMLKLILNHCVPLLAIVCAVSSILIPYQSAFLPEFSTVGIVYNLIIPFLFSIAMPPIIASILCYPIKALARIFSYIGSQPLYAGLFCIEHPLCFPFNMIDGAFLPETMARFVITGVFIGGIVTIYREKWESGYGIEYE